MNKRRAKTSLKKYTSHFIARFACERELETEQRLQYIDPHSNGHQRCVFRVLQGCSTGGPEAHSAGCGLSLPHLITNWSGPQTPSGVLRAPSAGWWLSLPHLLFNLSDLQLTDFLSSPSYIIVQLPTQSLEWHVWSSSSGNNCHAVQRSLSSGASVYECIIGFYLVPFCQPNPPTWFLSITGHWNVSLPSGASLWNGMFGRVEGQYTTSTHLSCSHSCITVFLFTQLLHDGSVKGQYAVQGLKINKSNFKKKKKITSQFCAINTWITTFSCITHCGLLSLSFCVYHSCWYHLFVYFFFFFFSFLIKKYQLWLRSLIWKDCFLYWSSTKFDWDQLSCFRSTKSTHIHWFLYSPYEESVIRLSPNLNIFCSYFSNAAFNGEREKFW